MIRSKPRWFTGLLDHVPCHNAHELNIGQNERHFHPQFVLKNISLEGAMILNKYIRQQEVGRINQNTKNKKYIYMHLRLWGRRYIYIYIFNMLMPVDMYRDKGWETCFGAKNKGGLAYRKERPWMAHRNHRNTKSFVSPETIPDLGTRCIRKNKSIHLYTLSCMLQTSNHFFFRKHEKDNLPCCNLTLFTSPPWRTARALLPKTQRLNRIQPSNHRFGWPKKWHLPRVFGPTINLRPNPASSEKNRLLGVSWKLGVSFSEAHRSYEVGL